MARQRSKELPGTLILVAVSSTLILVGWASFYSIAYNPVWLVTKYRKLRRYVVAQAKHETNDFTSNLWRTQWNAFGMRQPASRETTSTGAGPTGFASYRYPAASLLDLFKWFDSTDFPTTVENALTYASQLKQRNYYQDRLTNYVNGLNYYL